MIRWRKRANTCSPATPRPVSKDSEVFRSFSSSTGRDSTEICFNRNACLTARALTSPRMPCSFRKSRKQLPRWIRLSGRLIFICKTACQKFRIWKIRKVFPQNQLGIPGFRPETPTDREFSVRIENNPTVGKFQSLIAEPPIELPGPESGQSPPVYAPSNWTLRFEAEPSVCPSYL